MKIQNRQKLLAKMSAIPAEARRQIRKAIEVSSEEMAATARSFAPRRSGALAASIGYRMGEYKPSNANVRGVVSGSSGAADPDLTATVFAGDERAWYARLVEFGTRPRVIKNYHGAKGVAVSAGSMPPQPYFLPAYRLTKKRVTGRVSRATISAAKKVARK